VSVTRSFADRFCDRRRDLGRRANAQERPRRVASRPLKRSLARGIAALHTIEPRADRPTPIALGADKAYDAEDFVNELRSMHATPHVAQNTSGRILVEDASLVSLNPQADQIARDVVALRQSMERLAREKLLSHPALELDAVRTTPGHGVPPFESPA
jgi:hypothetical protein